MIPLQVIGFLMCTASLGIAVLTLLTYLGKRQQNDRSDDDGKEDVDV